MPPGSLGTLAKVALPRRVLLAVGGCWPHEAPCPGGHSCHHQDRRAVRGPRPLWPRGRCCTGRGLCRPTRRWQPTGPRDPLQSRLCHSGSRRAGSRSGLSLEAVSRCQHRWSPCGPPWETACPAQPHPLPSRTPLPCQVPPTQLSSRNLAGSPSPAGPCRAHGCLGLVVGGSASLQNPRTRLPAPWTSEWGRVWSRAQPV